MPFPKVREKAILLYSQRAVAGVTESELRKALDESLSHGDAATVAKHCGVTAQYLSDMRRGKRAISDAVLERLRRLK
jgi:transcriptional regulator with XRE-family HTH domain